VTGLICCPTNCCCTAADGIEDIVLLSSPSGKLGENGGSGSLGIEARGGVDALVGDSGPTCLGGEWGNNEPEFTSASNFFSSAGNMTGIAITNTNGEVGLTCNAWPTPTFFVCAGCAAVLGVPKAFSCTPSNEFCWISRGSFDLEGGDDSAET
jgi:hypothetical protein